MAAHRATRSQIERQISGALRDTINKHGAIDEKLIGSAARRVYGTLFGGNDAPEPAITPIQIRPPKQKPAKGPARR